MLVYILYIGLIFLGLIAPSRRQQKLILFLSCVYMCLMMGLRPLTVGDDTRQYVKDFLLYKNLSWGEVFETGSNYAFYIFNKLLSYVFPNSGTAYLMIVSVIISVSVYYFIKNNSEDFVLSQIMLLGLGFTLFFMTGIKQTLAMAVLLFAYQVLKKKNYFLFVILVALATMFHNTAAVFILLLPLSFLKKPQYMLLVAPALILLLYLSRNIIVEIVLTALHENELYAVYGTIYFSENNLTGLFIQLFIMVLSLFLYYSSSYRNTDLENVINIYTIGISFQTFTQVFAEFFRLSMYFSIFGILLFPNTLYHSSMGKNNIAVVRVAAGLSLVVYLFMFNIGGYEYPLL